MIFSSFDLAKFGLALKSLRQKNQFSQSHVNKACGINVDTLRRIENGYVIPKYETLELLSNVYKYDLLLLLGKFRMNPDIYSLYESIDTIIVNHNLKDLQNLKINISNLLAHEQEELKLVNYNDLIQLNLFIEGIFLYETENKKKHSLQLLTEALLISIPAFDLDLFSEFNYNYLELRILLLIAIILIDDNAIEKSTKILIFIHGKISFYPIMNTNIQKLLLKIYTNISYNFHRLDDYWNALLYSQKGIDFALSHTLIESLHLLYARKGIALYYLGLKNFYKFCHYSITLLEMQNNYNLANEYRSIYRIKYDIIIK